MTEISTRVDDTVGVGIAPSTSGAKVYNGSQVAAQVIADASGSAVLDSAHVGDIIGAFGRIARDTTSAGHNRWQRLRTLMVITGPGLIVMVGDNDAGGVATYAQAGQNYGMNLLWTLVLMIPLAGRLPARVAVVFIHATYGAAAAAIDADPGPARIHPLTRKPPRHRRTPPTPARRPARPRLTRQPALAPNRDRHTCEQS
jgi:hypothetical protein